MGHGSSGTVRMHLAVLDPKGVKTADTLVLHVGDVVASKGGRSDERWVNEPPEGVFIEQAGLYVPAYLGTGVLGYWGRGSGGVLRG